MLKKFLIAILPLALIIAFPLFLRKSAEKIDLSADQLVIITPHNEAIRFEYEQAFRQFYFEQTGRRVSIDWRSVGGTSDIARYVSSAFTANFREYWVKELKQTWNEEVAQAFLDRRLASDHQHYPAREAFLRSNVSIGVDLFFGGGQYDLNKQANMGTLVPCGVKERHPEWFEGQKPILVEKMGGEIWYDNQDKYYGTCFSSFGICQNLDRLSELGFDSSVEHPPLRAWTDLADPRLFGQLGVADPSKSGSINKCFEMLVQKQMRDTMRKLHRQLAAGELTEAEALNQGWQEAMTVIKKIGGNARYLTFAAGKIPLDTASGQIAAGMCIDLYGRSQAEWEETHQGRKTIVYHTPAAASSVSADPIGLFRGAPNLERAQMFIDFALSRQGQKLWNTIPGKQEGPQKYALHRLPIRSDLYNEADRKDMTAPEADPFQLAADFTYEGAWTGPLFDVLRTMVKIMVIDCHDELKGAWLAIIKAGGPETATEAYKAFQKLPFAHQDAQTVAKKLYSPEDQTVTTREWTIFFRKQYQLARELAQ